MPKGTKLSEFEKGEITALNRVGKSQKEISKALGCSKTIICTYLKSPNNYGTRRPIGRPEKLSYLPTPSAQAGYDTRSIFKRSLTGLNSEFSFS